MRRAAPTAGLSPQLLKHFAIATVVITLLLALFASGEEWGAQAQMEAIDAKNRLAAAEAEKLGTAKVSAKLKVRKGTGSSMVYDGAPDFSSGSGGGGGGGGGGVQDYGFQPRARHTAPRNVAQAREAQFKRKLGAAAGTDQGDPDAEAARKGSSGMPDLETMVEASRQRSGSSNGDPL